MLKYIIQQLKRSIVLNAAFCLLLALAGTLLSLGTGLLFTAVSSARQANDTFTTIALPDFAAIGEYSLNYARNSGITELEMWDGSVITPAHFHFYDVIAAVRAIEIRDNIRSNILGSGEFDMDARRVFGGYSSGITPHIIRPNFDSWASWPIAWSPNATAAFIAVAENVRHEYVLGRDFNTESTHFHEVIITTFVVEETLLLHPTYTAFPVGTAVLNVPVETFEIRLGAQRADGTPLIEEGKRYFVFGRGFHQLTGGLFDLPQLHPQGEGYINRRDFRELWWFDLEPVSVFYSIDYIHPVFRAPFQDIPEDEWSFTAYSRIFDYDPLEDPFSEFRRNNTGFRWLIELPDDPSAPIPDALQSEIDEILAMGRKSVDTMIVMTTNRLDSFFRFNQRRARIVEGRAFTAEEIETGARVVLINELTEGVEVGDIITLQLYEVTATEFAPIDSQAYWNITQPYSPVSLVTEPMEFEVIGKFSTPSVDESEQAIPPNAIFIPDNSVAEFPFIVPELTDTLQQSLDEAGMSFDEWLNTNILRQEMEDMGLPRYISILNTIIIPNGENQAFADAVNAILPDYSAFFRIYDQGFSTVGGAIDNLMRSGTLILILCGAGWIIALLVFCLFYILRKRKEAGLLYALGINKKHRFRWLFVQCIVIVVLSQVIAFGVSSALYERTVDFAIEAAESAAPEQVADFTDAVIADDGEEIEFTICRDPYAIPIAAAGQLAILLLISGGMSASIVGKGVVSLRRGGDG